MNFGVEHIATIVVTLITALSSERAWRHFSTKQKATIENKKEDRKDANMYRDDLRKEVERLRGEMVALYAARDQERKKMSEELADIREQLASFRTRVEFLERENTELRERLAQWKARAELQGFNITED